MVKNYIKVAWRNLIKNKTHSFINIMGLCVGMAAALLIGLWITDEISFNTYHKNYDRIAQVRTRITGEDRVGINSSLQYPLATELKANYRDNFKHVVRASWDVDDVLSTGGKMLSRKG